MLMVNDLVDVLVRDAVIERVSTSVLTVHEYQGRVLAPPVRVTVSDESLQAFFAAAAEDAMQVFPDVDPERGAYRLLLVNLDSILSSDAKVTSLNIDAEGVGVTRAGHRDPALPGVEEEPAGTYSWELESPPGR